MDFGSFGAGFGSFGSAAGVPRIVLENTNPRLVYSLRDVYGTGNDVVRLRRSHDDQEQDFTANELRDAYGMGLFLISGSTAHVVKWYQQNPDEDVDLIQTSASSQPVLDWEGSNSQQPYIRTTTADNTKLLVTLTSNEVWLEQDISICLTSNIEAGSANGALLALSQGGSGRTSNVRALEIFPSGGNAGKRTLRERGGTTATHAFFGVESDWEGAYKTGIARTEGDTNGNNSRSVYLDGSQQSSNTTNVGTFNSFSFMTLSHYLVYAVQTSSTQRVTEIVIYDRIISDEDRDLYYNLSAEMRY